MPSDAHTVAPTLQAEVDRDPGQRQQHQGGEHARHLQAVARLQDAIREAGREAAGAGDELRHHRADQCQSAGNAQTREEVRQRRRQAQQPQRREAACAIERNRSASSAGADARPAAVLANTGKNATIVAQTTSEANGSPTHTMISGAIATIGVTCSTTAQGWIAAASRRLDAIATASTTPSNAATSKRSECHQQRRAERQQQPRRIGQECRDDRRAARAPDRTARR